MSSTMRVFWISTGLREAWKYERTRSRSTRALPTYTTAPSAFLKR